jgi:opacity protein-like surface antigen
MHKEWNSGLLIALSLLTMTRCASADDRRIFFPRGTTDLSLYASYATPTLGDDERYYSLTGSAGYYLFDDFSINLGIVGHRINSSSGATGWAGETNAMLRWHFLTIDRWTIFAEAGCGFLYSDHELPADGDGTHWNFTPQGGLGATYLVQDNFFIIGGVRYFHASNAGLQGDDRHPGSNAVMGYLGTMWTW